ncbi:23S rRNA methyltransferase [Philodulcilactobacillus myokoensis]|uniref:23S rRNA methyltransferase n=1 Tax=Philodulcilactobacillus myokoensis TaxID=2929573 RepID=A0A9W6B1G8_9LACO|nr:RNA methyltransferase [Philodulcilactobacillus myokoensis]GLB46770.1 23S rRNA methyltransferase [Philodulcilactobacillus myokoensis]
MEKITSSKNEQIKQIIKLKRKHDRIKFNSYLLESWHLVYEALKSNARIKKILTTPKQFQLHSDQLDHFQDIVLISDEVSKKLGSTLTPQGIFAIVQLPKTQHINPNATSGGWLLLDQIQDPGNIGTMVRTADAIGLSGVVFGSGTASRFNPKVLRAMQGSQFHLHLIEADLEQWIDGFKNQQVPVYGTELNPNAVDFRDVHPKSNYALIMGNEGNGIQKQYLSQTNLNLYIPIKGQAESFNVAIAAGILMFQLQK